MRARFACKSGVWCDYLVLPLWCVHSFQTDYKFVMIINCVAWRCAPHERRRSPWKFSALSSNVSFCVVPVASAVILLLCRFKKALRLWQVRSIFLRTKIHSGGISQFSRGPHQLFAFFFVTWSLNKPKIKIHRVSGMGGSIFWAFFRFFGSQTADALWNCTLLERLLENPHACRILWLR
jgi:hypothetical protein